MNDRDRFDKFTGRARKVLSLSQEEAQRFQHNYIGTEHLLLGLIREGEGVAAKVLVNLGVDLAKARSAVEFIIGRGDRIVLGEIGLTPRAKKVIELAVDEARRLNHHYIGTEHLLLGMVREGDGIGVGVLESLGVNLDNVRSQILQCLSLPDDQSSSVREPIIFNAVKDEVASDEVALLFQTPSDDSDQSDKFTAHARRALSLAQEEAQRFQHNYVGTEHLLLGLIREEEGVAAKVLEGLEVALNKVRSAVEFIIGRGDRIVLGEIGLTPRSKKVIELAVDEARRLNHHYLGTPHLLLGLVREGEGIAAGVLESLGVNLEKTRSATLQYIVSVESNQPSTVEEPISFNGVALSHQTHLATLLFCHIHSTAVAPARAASWLRGAAVAGWPLPLGLAHDLGLLLSHPANRLTLARPDYLPFDEDTSAYLSCLQRLVAHPVLRDISSWSPPLSDAVLSVLLARLVEGLELAQEYRLPGGPDGV
ncbi:MAG TPA: Clp protease N-terminal domain-containing protein, partial [Ktedonobacteraceae bacterium]